MFEQASRLKLRFNTVKGLLLVEDLWFIPLSSVKSDVANLNSIAIDLDKQLKESTTISFVEQTSTKENTELQLKFDIVKHIIDVRLEENKAASQEREKKQQKQELMELIQRKKAEQTESLPLEELEKKLAAL